MNSVNLANKVWQEIKSYSVVPTHPLLMSVVIRVAEDNHCIMQHVIVNAFHRVVKRMDEVAVLMKLWRNSENKSSPLSQSTLDLIHKEIASPIKEGPI